MLSEMSPLGPGIAAATHAGPTYADAWPAIAAASVATIRVIGIVGLPDLGAPVVALVLIEGPMTENIFARLHLGLFRWRWRGGRRGARGRGRERPGGRLSAKQSAGEHGSGAHHQEFSHVLHRLTFL